tara:strand:- start:572 stop:721 length:150 start_codon:yes stop_codon:yes gene_type:complete
MSDYKHALDKVKKDVQVVSGFLDYINNNYETLKNRGIEITHNGKTILEK